MKNNPLNTSTRRLPAEWEPHDSVLMAWPHEHTDWAYMLEEAQGCIADIVRAIAEEEHVILVGPASLCAESVAAQGFNLARVHFFDIPTNDTWARDFGPITIEADGSLRALDFKFNGWGLKFAANHDNLVNSQLPQNGTIMVSRENHLDFVLEGGSIECDGKGTLLTTAECLLSPNRNGGKNKNEIERYLIETLGVIRVLWLEHGGLEGDDTDSHIDTLARLAPNDTIIYCGAGDTDNPNHARLASMLGDLQNMRTLNGLPFNLLELPLPDPIVIDGELLPATYANYLVTPTRILLPSYGQLRNDRLAAQIMKVAYPTHDVVQINCLPLIRQHGSLHCATMQLPVGTIKFSME